MIRTSWNLYEIISKTFNSKTWNTGEQYDLENEWHHFLIELNVIVETISGATNSHGSKGIAEAIVDLMFLLENGVDSLDESELDKYVACPDPISPWDAGGAKGFCSVLLFPKELAERILILGCLPCPVVDKAL